MLYTDREIRDESPKRYIAKCQIEGEGVRYKPIVASSQSQAQSLAEKLLGQTGVLLDIHQQ